MNYVCIPENWVKPRFAFGDIVTLSSLPNPLMWYGVVRGLNFARFSQIWSYEVEIFKDSELLPIDFEANLFVTWLEPKIKLVDDLPSCLTNHQIK
jgi:hypothetical protein